ncbi:hypothetical protein Avbf_00387 [Armadillidium vulgare]|nr:hypothetical protein Avbf_00387 [Armadillidium vulgare]
MRCNETSFNPFFKLDLLKLIRTKRISGHETIRVIGLENMKLCVRVGFLIILALICKGEKEEKNDRQKRLIIAKVPNLDKRLGNNNNSLETLHMSTSSCQHYFVQEEKKKEGTETLSS